MNEPAPGALPRRVTRADAFPAGPPPPLPLAPEPPPADGAVKSFGCSALLGFGAFVLFAGSSMTHTSGTPRSVELAKRERKAAIAAELRAAEAREAGARPTDPEAP